MKRLLCAVAGLVAVTCWAGTYNFGVVTGGIQPASTATNRTVSLDVSRQTSISVAVTAQADDEVSADLILAYTRSHDRENYDVDLELAGLAFASTNATTQLTNIPTYGAQYIHFIYTTNSSGAVGITNFAVRALQVQ